jgi:hypothetical protein
MIMKMNITRLAAILSGLLLLMPMYTAFADSVSLEQLSAEWQEWANSIPTPENPVLDTSGQSSMIGQHGAVWFLAGVGGSGAATRACSVPEGKRLYFPVINQNNINAPGVCGQGNVDISVKDLRAAIAPIIDAATNLSAILDGVPIKNITRVKSVVFAVALPADNVFLAGCGGAGTVPAGVYSPAVDDGFYVLLNPLSVGPHVLHFHGESGSVVQDVTYNLTVVKVLTK